MGVNIYFIATLLTIITGVAAIVGYLLKQHRNSIQSIVTEALSPVNKRLDEALTSVNTRLTVIDTKMDLMEVFWQNIAIDMARTLHHPESSRVRVDALLDDLMTKRLSDDDSEELRGYLEVIRDWEPGSPSPFKIFQGEQVAAAILLHTMGHVTNPGMKEHVKR